MGWRKWHPRQSDADRVAQTRRAMRWWKCKAFLSSPANAAYCRREHTHKPKIQVHKHTKRQKINFQQFITSSPNAAKLCEQRETPSALPAHTKFVPFLHRSHVKTLLVLCSHKMCAHVRLLQCSLKSCVHKQNMSPVVRSHQTCMYNVC